MYHKKSDSIIYIVASFMVTFVIVFMAGTTYCRVQNENIVEPKKEVKMIARIEGWNQNNKDFNIDDKKVEININATGSSADVKYRVYVTNIPDGVKLYKDENLLYELSNEFEGIINYKETMKEKIVFFIENSNEVVPEVGEDLNNIPELDENIEDENSFINVKLEFEKVENS